MWEFYACDTVYMAPLYPGNWHCIQFSLPTVVIFFLIHLPQIQIQLEAVLEVRQELSLYHSFSLWPPHSDCIKKGCLWGLAIKQHHTRVVLC